ncbi:hypothetical protein BJ170DRAFT_679193 [Xylariales sp. AK1849]|nr:hypothetical protein BJ170DRAFT_679193 [Xylariales sp. AK1849]
MALVKKFVAAQKSKHFELKMVPAMIDDLYEFRRLSIVIGDIRAPNYLGGNKTDFSHSDATRSMILDGAKVWEKGYVPKLRPGKRRDGRGPAPDAAKDNWKVGEIVAQEDAIVQAKIKKKGQNRRT